MPDGFDRSVTSTKIDVSHQIRLLLTVHIRTSPRTVCGWPLLRGTIGVFPYSIK
jgi:hypothetical protein